MISFGSKFLDTNKNTIQRKKQQTISAIWCKIDWRILITLLQFIYVHQTKKKYIDKITTLLLSYLLAMTYQVTCSVLKGFTISGPLSYQYCLYFYLFRKLWNMKNNSYNLSFLVRTKWNEYLKSRIPSKLPGYTICIRIKKIWNHFIFQIYMLCLIAQCRVD